MIERNYNTYAHKILLTPQLYREICQTSIIFQSRVTSLQNDLKLKSGHESAKSMGCPDRAQHFSHFFRGLAPGITGGSGRIGGDFRQVHNDGAPLRVGARRVGQKIDDVWRVAQGFRNVASTSMSLS